MSNAAARRLPNYLTVVEAAKLMRCSTSALYGLIRDRAIPHTPIGRRVVIDADELAQWLEARTVRPEGDAR